MIPDLATYPRRYLTVAALARCVRRPLPTLYWHIREGKLTVVRFGRLIRVETDEARRWADLYAFPVDEQQTYTRP